MGGQFQDVCGPEKVEVGEMCREGAGGVREIYRKNVCGSVRRAGVVLIMVGLERHVGVEGEREIL